MCGTGPVDIGHDRNVAHGVMVRVDGDEAQELAGVGRLWIEARALEQALEVDPSTRRRSLAAPSPDRSPSNADAATVLALVATGRLYEPYSYYSFKGWISR